MKYILGILTTIIFAACAQTPTQSSTEAAPEKKANSVYVQVVSSTGAEVTGEYAEVIRDEAYSHYKTMGLTPAANLADADMVVVFNASEKVIQKAVNMKMEKTNLGKGKDAYVLVRNERGEELFNPIADTIRNETYRKLIEQGYERAQSQKQADVTVMVYTNDQALRAAVRKVITKQ